MKDFDLAARMRIASQDDTPKAFGARLISVILHPFLVGPVVFLHFSFAGTENPAFGWLVWSITFIATNVVIGTYVALMKRRGITTSVDVPERLLRRKPFAIGAAGYAVATLVLYLIEAPVTVVVLMSIYAVNTIIATVINHWWKISIHGMAISGVLVPFLYLYGGSWWWLFMLFPLMIYSRTKLKAHTPAQAISGIALAFILTWLQLELWI